MSYIMLSDLRGLGDVAPADVQGVMGILVAARGPVSAGNIESTVALWSTAAVKAAAISATAAIPRQAPLQGALASFASAAQRHATASGLTPSDLQSDQTELEGLLNEAISMAGGVPVASGMSTTTRLGLGVGIAALLVGIIWYATK